MLPDVHKLAVRFSRFKLPLMHLTSIAIFDYRHRVEGEYSERPFQAYAFLEDSRAWAKEIRVAMVS